VRITKMHALGNNYIYVSLFEENIENLQLPALSRAVSDVRKGIGSDGLILIGPSAIADVMMRIFNADGSEAQTCGNGLRCVAKYAYEHGYVTSTQFSIEVETGVMRTEVYPSHDGVVQRVTVDMGLPKFGADAVDYAGQNSALTADDYASVRIPTSAGTVEGVMVSMGNPHWVSFVDEVSAIDVATLGPEVECHPFFPNRINVEFVAVSSRKHLDFRVWERGSGITYACGTGACASAAAAVRRGLLDAKSTVHLLGGDLEIEVSAEGVLMTGEAIHVLAGEYNWP